MFHQLFYKPMYNILVFILDILPTHDVALAVIVLTVFIKIVLLPLSHKMFKTQIIQRKIQPLITKIQEEYKDNRQMLGVKMLEIYKEYKLNPFSSILLMIIQIPIVFALYFVFANGGLPNINMADLYSFTPNVDTINHILYGVDFTKANIMVGLLAALFQYIQIRLSLQNMTPVDKNKPNKDLKPEEMMQKQMGFMMKYFIPILIFVASLKVSAAVALYWIVSSVFMIAQELYFRNKYKEELLDLKTK
jgi:YidC/Oxa1 family membrane protein insertase